MTVFTKFFATVLQLNLTAEQSTETGSAETENIARDYQRAVSAGSIEALERFLYEHPPERHPDVALYYKRAMSVLNDYAVSPRLSAGRQVTKAQQTGVGIPTPSDPPAEPAAAGARPYAETFRNGRY